MCRVNGSRSNQMRKWVFFWKLQMAKFDFVLNLSFHELKNEFSQLPNVKNQSELKHWSSLWNEASDKVTSLCYWIKMSWQIRISGWFGRTAPELGLMWVERFDKSGHLACEFSIWHLPPSQRGLNRSEIPDQAINWSAKPSWVRINHIWPESWSWCRFRIW